MINSKKSIKIIFCITCFVIFFLLSNIIVFSIDQQWPSRPISLVVPWKPGGGTDIATRALQPLMEEYLGVPLVVTNVAGASGSIAFEKVYRAPKDGYTICCVATSMMNYPATAVSDIVIYKDFAMIGKATPGVPCFVVHPDSPYKTINDLIEAMKTKEITAAVDGVAGPWMVGMLVLSNAVGGDFIPVPQGGGYPAAIAAMKKETDVGVCDVSEALSLFQQGQLRALSYLSDEPFDVPGYGIIPPITDFVPSLAPLVNSVRTWRGMAYPKGVPNEIIEKVRDAYNFATNHEDFKEFCKKQEWSSESVVGEKAQIEVEIGTKVVSWLLFDIGAATRSPSDVGVPRP